MQYHNEYQTTKDTADDSTYDYAMRWVHTGKTVPIDGSASGGVNDAKANLEAVHPIYMIPWGAVERCHQLFKQAGL